MGLARSLLWLASLAALCVSAPTHSASATADALAPDRDAMRVDDPTPRQVLVEFEVSSSDHPDRLDRRYSRPFPARVESDAAGNTVVRIAGRVLEQSLFDTRNPVPGSFSDYVWVFDGATGEVLSASFTGKLLHRLNLGLTATDVEARVEGRMTTTQPGGFTVPRLVFGRRLRRFCDAAERDRCTLVEPTRYDRQRGYVNAVGFLQIESSLTRFSTYSALGEARFSEVGSARPNPAPPEVPALWAATDAPGARAAGAGVHAPVFALDPGNTIDVSAPPPSN